MLYLLYGRWLLISIFGFELISSRSTQAEVCLPLKMSKSENVTGILDLSQLLQILNIYLGQTKCEKQCILIDKRTDYQPYNLTIKRLYMTFLQKYPHSDIEKKPD